MKNKKKISVIGAGAWGTGIATVIANKYPVTLFDINHNIVSQINQDHSNSYLPQIKLSKNIVASDNFSYSILNRDFIFLAIPSKILPTIVKKIAQEAIDKNTILIICSKGIDEKTLKLSSQTLEEDLSNEYAILSGPNFAIEVAEKLPTITNVASKNKRTALKIIKILKNDYFLPIYLNDVVFAQISATIKNILAIGCGMIDGLKMGENLKAALITKGIDEIILLSKKMGGREKSIISAAGFGDIFLTCSSRKSRNNTLGYEIGSGGVLKKSLEKNNTTFEGFIAADLICKLAEKIGINLPVCNQINRIIKGLDSPNKIDQFIRQRRH